LSDNGPKAKASAIKERGDKGCVGVGVEFVGGPNNDGILLATPPDDVIETAGPVV